VPPPLPPSTTAPKSSSTHPRPPPHQTPAMAHFNLSVRPDFDVCNLPFSEEIRDRIDFFESRSVVVWIGKNMPYTNTSHVMEAFMSRFGLEKSSIQVSCHHPTDFLVIILDQDVFEEVAGHHSFPHGRRQFWLRRWSPRNQATRAAMRYYVRLCLEGLPLHLWSDRFTAAVLGRSCALHFVEESSRRRESTEVFELLAWTTDPVAIPLRVWLTVLDVDRSGHASPRVVIHRLRPMEPRCGMVYEVLIHVLSVEIQGGLGRTVGRCSTLSISISVFRTPIKRWCRRRGLESKKLSWRLTQLGIGCLLGTPARLSTGGRTAAPTGKTTKMKQATVAAPPRRSGEACSSVSGGWCDIPPLSRDGQS
jgi:hypothetical protein